MRIIFFFIFFLPFSSLCAAEPSLSVQVQPSTRNRMEGIITIVHDPQAKIANNSFRIGNKPLSVESLSAETQSTETRSDRTKSFYRFTFLSPTKGLHLLPSISVQVDGKKIQTAPLTYTVSPSAPKDPLVLTAEVQGTAPFYPGQRLKFVYRIAYRGTIDLTKEDLPLLQPKGFEKIGAVQVREYSTEDYDIQEITVEARALQAGNFSFNRSLIEGVTYSYLAGEALPKRAFVKSIVPPFEIEILPFPEEGKPPSFAGALGRFTLQVERISPEKMNLGDELQIKITLAGEGELDTASIPYLFCQPGFSGFFASGILPPQEKTAGKTKEFLLRLRPLSPLISEVPPIEYSSFDPQLRVYYTTRSAALPLIITPLATSVEAITKTKEQKIRILDDLEEDKTDWKSEISQAFPQAPLFVVEAKRKSLFASWSLFFYLCAAAVAAFFLQKYLILQRNASPKTSSLPSSHDFLKDATKHSALDGYFTTELQNALLLALVEAGVLSRIPENPQELSEEGIGGKVKAFLNKIEKIRYAQGEPPPFSEILQEAQVLYKEIKKGPSS